MGRVVPHDRLPTPRHPSLVLDAELDYLTSPPHMPVTITVLVSLIQVDYEFLFAHLSPPARGFALNPIVVHLERNGNGSQG